VIGRYSFTLPDLAGGLRPLRDPDQADEDDDELSCLNGSGPGSSGLTSDGPDQVRHDMADYLT
jgi:hypothetical protein